jgi:hypothetical protein
MEMDRRFDVSLGWRSEHAEASISLVSPCSTFFSDYLDFVGLRTLPEGLGHLQEEPLPESNANLASMRPLIVGLFLFAHYLFAQAQSNSLPVDSMMHWRDATIALGKVVTTGPEKKFVVSGTAVVVAVDAQRLPPYCETHGSKPRHRDQRAGIVDADDFREGRR